MRDGTCRIKAAFASGTPRSTSFVSSLLRALDIFDTFKGQMGQMATLHKSFANTMVAIKGSCSDDSGTLDATPPDWSDEVEDGYLIRRCSRWLRSARRGRGWKQEAKRKRKHKRGEQNA